MARIKDTNSKETSPAKKFKKADASPKKPEPKAKKPRVRKKTPKDERSYHPSQDRKRRQINPDSHHTENLIKLMDADSSPAKRGIFANSTELEIEFENNELHTPTKKHKTVLLTPTKFQFSTPEKGPLARYATTPKGSKFLPSRLIECDDGAMTLFLPEDKVSSEEIAFPSQPKDWIKKSPIPKGDMNGLIDVKITKEEIKKVEALSRKRKRDGENPRKISQNKVMGDIGATQAMRKAGIDAPDASGQYTHLIAFNLIGDKGQCVKNLGIGTRFANAAMELVNPAIKRLLYQKKNALPAIYVSAIPEWVPGYEDIRLLKTITMIIKDAPGDNFKHSAKIKFNMLSMARVCLTDVLPVRKFIMAKFSANPQLKMKNIISAAITQHSVNTPTKVTPPVVDSLPGSPLTKQEGSSSVVMTKRRPIPINWDRCETDELDVEETQCNLLFTFTDTTKAVKGLLASQEADMPISPKTDLPVFPEQQSMEAKKSESKKTRP
ncbi:MAG: hypothetical protein BGO43_10175 [Gammaproteobacteria bacterium 39-13]|nr:hypothetical protein [Gammaproteobacteria bacterium]OJV90293.1 MAG: hypothetical protein BGO43_10175 [Gammaproteobacteria bacterium 39-13]